MTSATAVVSSIEEALFELVLNMVPLDKSKFNSLGAYEEPLRSNRQVELNGRGRLTRDDGTIVRLRLPEQVIVFQRLEPTYGTLEHGILQRQLIAAHSPEGQKYRDNVLKDWVFTGEMGKEIDGRHEFGKVVKVEAIYREPTVVFEDDTQGQYNLIDYKFTLNRAGVYVPASTGHFDRLGDVEGRVYWNGIIDSQGRSAIRCSWLSDERRLGAVADWPLVEHGYGVVGAWRKAA